MISCFSPERWHSIMKDWPTSLPPLLSELHQLDAFSGVGDEIDFEPYRAFLSAEENDSWFKAWTGNPAVDGAEFRVFGQDGTGGYAALWLTQPAKDLEHQPVVFLGSEGERGVVAVNLHEYLWLLAGGVGPYEAVGNPGLVLEPKPQIIDFARSRSKVAELSASEVLTRAQSAYPTFSQYIDSKCR
jgi:hypothetical protein